MIKKVYYENGHPSRIHIGLPDRKMYFDINIRDIVLIFNGKKYHYHLTDSFFSKCPHINGAYNQLNVIPRGVNRLMAWLLDNNIQYVNIKVIQPFKVFEIYIN